MKIESDAPAGRPPADASLVERALWLKYSAARFLASPAAHIMGKDGRECLAVSADLLVDVARRLESQP